MSELNERFPIPKWANVVDVSVEDDVIRVDFDTEEPDILEDDDLEEL